MSNDDSLEMIAQLRTWVEECFLSLQAASSDEEKKNEAKARYREVIGIIHQLEKLHIPISEEIKSEKAALEEFLHTPNEEENQLTFLAKELSSLAKDINHRLQDRRSQKTPRGEKAPPKRLRVEFSDGTIIEENKATDTLVNTIQHIGLQRVSELPIKMNGCPLVSTRKHESARAIRELDGYFIETHSNTEGKAKCIQQIAAALRIDISVSVSDY